MLINLSYLPEILDQYKNITINENVSNVSYTKSIIYCQLFLFIYCLIIQARQTIILLQKLKKSQIFVKKWNKYYRYGQRWRLHFINIWLQAWSDEIFVLLSLITYLLYPVSMLDVMFVWNSKSYNLVSHFLNYEPLNCLNVSKFFSIGLITNISSYLWEWLQDILNEICWILWLPLRQDFDNIKTENAPYYYNHQYFSWSSVSVHFWRFLVTIKLCSVVSIIEHEPFQITCNDFPKRFILALF